MGRGGNQQQVQDSGNALLKTENQNATQNQQEGQNAYGFLMPAYSSMYSKPGYTDAQKSAITNATEGGTGAAFGAAGQEATNAAARTNNAAALPASMDSLARTRMRTAASQTDRKSTRLNSSHIPL